jgi:hypothetical protein
MKLLLAAVSIVIVGALTYLSRVVNLPERVRIEKTTEASADYFPCKVKIAGGQIVDCLWIPSDPRCTAGETEICLHLQQELKARQLAADEACRQAKAETSSPPFNPAVPFDLTSLIKGAPSCQ